MIVAYLYHLSVDHKITTLTSSISLELLHVTWNRDIARKERLGMDYKGCSQKRSDSLQC